MNPARRIRDDLATLIQSGALRPGDRIPIEQELAAKYGCARATVSKAIGELVAMGLIERRRKAGSFVAHPPVHSAVMSVPDLAELIAARGEIYRWETRAIEQPPSTKRELGNSLLVEGIHFASNEPFALEHRLISLDEVPAAADADFQRQAPGTWLLAHIPWSQVRHVISAVTPTSAERALFGSAPPSACLELERTTWRAGNMVTQVRQLFRGDRFDLVAEFNADL